MSESERLREMGGVGVVRGDVGEERDRRDFTNKGISKLYINTLWIDKTRYCLLKLCRIT